MAQRLTRRAGVRVADADEAELVELASIHDESEMAIRVAIHGQRTGLAQRSWPYIGASPQCTRTGAMHERDRGRSHRHHTQALYSLLYLFLVRREMGKRV